MDELDPELKALISRGARAFDPKPEDVRRVRSRLAGALSAPEAGRSLEWREPFWKGRGLKSGVLGLALGASAGGLIGFQLGAAGPPQRADSAQPRDLRDPRNGTLSFMAQHTQPERRSPVPGAERPKGSSPEEPLRSGEADLETARSGVPPQGARARKIGAREVGAGATTESSAPPDEIEQVRLVQLALGQGDAARALRLLAELDQEVPSGRLLEERAAGKAIARCLLDPMSGYRERTGFSKRFSPSVHDERVAAMCSGAEP